MQRRYLCGKCQREWAHARHWSFGDPCPAPDCGSLDVRQELYQPEFPGADVPRVAASVLAPLDGPNVNPQVNRTLAMACPEFA